MFIGIRTVAYLYSHESRLSMVADSSCASYLSRQASGRVGEGQ